MKLWNENGMRIGIKNNAELKHMRESGRILGLILHEIKQNIAPGISCLELDQLAEARMKEHGVKASFKGYQGFPNVICANINDQVVHGIPTKQKLQNGDIVTIDCGVIVNGFHSDSAITVGVGTITPIAQKLIATAEKSLKKAIQIARAGVRISKISGIIEDTVTKEGFTIIKDLIGHGIGTQLHEDPPVPNFRDMNKRSSIYVGNAPILQEGMTIAIEPIITNGSHQMVLEKDGWTYRTKDGSIAVQVEHTIAITKNGSEVLTQRPS